MKLNIKGVAIAEGLIMAVVFAICAVAIAVVPAQTATATKYLFHIDLSTLASPIRGGGFFSGLPVTFIAMALAGAVWAWIYNRVAHT